MTALRRKMLSDLSQEGTRTVLVVCAVAVGIAGFLTVLSAYAVLTRELNRQYLATVPASATLRMDRVDDALLAAVLTNPEIAVAEPKRIVGGRMRVGRGEWHDLKLFVVKDFRDIRTGRLQPERGSWPPAAGEMLVERDAFGVAGLRIGDEVTVKTAGQQERVLRIGGSVHDVGQAQARMENVVYAYIALDTLAVLGETPYFNWLNILVATGQFDEGHIRSVAAGVRKLAETRGYVVRRVDVPTPGEHPHAHIMALLWSVMSGFGFCVVALSGILVFNLVTATMALQVRQIGVMKAIGATRADISGISFGQMLGLGTAAIVIALPLGIAGGRELCTTMAGLLNFDIASFLAPPWVYLLAAAAGWVVPVVASAVPVWNGTRIPVRVALSEYGVSTEAFGTSGFDRLLAGLGGRFRPLQLALRNSFRRRARLSLTMATLVAGGLFFLAGLNVRASMIHTLDRSFATRKFDLSVGLSGMAPVDGIQRAARNTPGVVRAEAWIVTEGMLENARFTVIGLPANTTLLQPEIVEGRNLLPGDTDAIVLNTSLADGPASLRVGNTVTVQVGAGHALLRIVGIAREQLSPPVGYVPRRYAEQLTGNAGMANSIRLALERTDRASIQAVEMAIEGHLERENIRMEGSRSEGESRFGFDQHMLMVYVFLAIVSSIIAAIGGLGLMTTMSLNVMERRREMGVLRAIGASPRAVWAMVVTEGVFIAVLSFVLAAAASWPLSEALGNLLGAGVFQTGLDFRIDPEGLAIWLAVSIFLGVASSFLPAWQCSRTTVREALSQE